MLFALKYATKSIQRRFKGNIGILLSIAFGVSLLVSSSLGSDGILYSQRWAIMEHYGEEHIIITDTDHDNGLFSMENYDLLRDSEIEVNGVDPIAAISPQIDFRSKLYAKGRIEEKIGFRGINPAETGFDSFYNIDGEILDLTIAIADSEPIYGIIDCKLAEMMNITIGNTVQASVFNGLGEYLPIKIEINAIYDVDQGRGKYFEEHIFFNLNRIQQEFAAEYQNYINIIAIKMIPAIIPEDYGDINFHSASIEGSEEVRASIDQISSVLQNTLPNNNINAGILEVEKLDADEVGFTSNLAIFSLFLNLMALLMIINIQTITIEDRKNQTAVLRALGANRGSIIRIFLIEAFILGICGSAIGLGMGRLVGEYIMRSLGMIFFDTPGIFPGYKLSLIISSSLLGIGLAIGSALAPALNASKESIAGVLRGADKAEDAHKRTPLTLFLGIGLVVTGIFFLVFRMKPFWELSSWLTYEDHIFIVIGFASIVLGLGFSLKYLMKRSLPLGIAAFLLVAIAIFDSFIAESWMDPNEFEPGAWGPVNSLTMLLGMIIIITVTYDKILAFFNWIFSQSKSTRGISQITTKMMRGNKSRGIFAFSIITCIMMMMLFMSSMTETQRVGLIEDHEWRSYGIDIMLKTDIPSSDAQAVIEECNGVQKVYSFRSSYLPIYTEYPATNNTGFDQNKHLKHLKVVEVPEEIINPNANWDENSLPFAVYQMSADSDYTYSRLYNPEKQKEFSIELLDDFLDNKNRTVILDLTEKDEEGNVVAVSREITQFMIIGDSKAQYDELNKNYYLEAKNGEILSLYSESSSFNMMGDGFMMGGAILITPEMAANLPIFDLITEPNLFLIKTDAAFEDETRLAEISSEMETHLNDLEDPDSLSYQAGILIGASTDIIYSRMAASFEVNVKVWSFLQVFSFIGLIMGALGLVVISFRSVSERRREIGMMRAIGFERKDVVISVLMELFIIMILAITSGTILGIVLAETFCGRLFGLAPNYPVWENIVYVLILLGVALCAGFIPGYKAARIAPSQALRYSS